MNVPKFLAWKRALRILWNHSDRPDSIESGEKTGFASARSVSGDSASAEHQSSASVQGVLNPPHFLVTGGALQSSVLANLALEDDAAKAASRIGQHIGSYKLTKLLGVGGMGAVYLAARESKGFHQEVALKLLGQSVADDTSRTRFEMERNILAQLNHPHIAQLLDGGESDEGLLYFTIELVNGIPISEYCTKNGLPITERLRLLLQVASAIAYAHRHLVVHRDIKSSNILVLDGQSKLLDFGIAKMVGQYSGPALTRAEVGPMTPEYAAPEQFRGGSITVATDVYQFGVLCYKVLTERFPFNPEGEDYYAWSRAVLEEEPVSLRKAIDVNSERETQSEIQRQQLKRQLTPDLDAIVRKALSKVPDDRYPTMDALISDVDALLTGRPVAARRAGRLYFLGKFILRWRYAVARRAAAGCKARRVAKQCN